MENQIKVFEEREVLGQQFRMFGTIESPLFLAKDVAQWIGHEKADVMIKSIDSDEKVKVNNVYVDGRTGGNGVWLITEDGLYEVLMQSRKPIAKQFKKQVKAILKELRLNGRVELKPQKSVYTEDERKKLADAKLLNAKARAANVWLKLSKESSVPTFKDICVAYGSAVMNDGTPILSLPAAPERTYSAKEIGEMVGMSANKVGLLTNKFALKTDTYGQWVWDKSEHSAKQVRTFRYNIRIVEALQELLAKGVA